MSATVITYDVPVTRWEPDARGRLEQAALQLFVERGYDNTTVAEIADKAGVTERTFFRHFVDKREVLFSGSDALRQLLTDSVLAAPKHLAPIDAVGAALESASEVMNDRRDIVPLRQALISGHPELLERELIKLASLADALAVALRKRGVKERSARLTAEVGIAAFKIAFEQWAVDPKRRNLPRLLRESIEELKAVTNGATAGRHQSVL
jgi:AcrR family transcriptional regulator